MEDSFDYVGCELDDLRRDLAALAQQSHDDAPKILRLVQRIDRLAEVLERVSASNAEAHRRLDQFGSPARGALIREAADEVMRRLAIPIVK